MFFVLSLSFFPSHCNFYPSTSHHCLHTALKEFICFLMVRAWCGQGTKRGHDIGYARVRIQVLSLDWASYLAMVKTWIKNVGADSPLNAPCLKETLEKVMWHRFVTYLPMPTHQGQEGQLVGGGDRWWRREVGWSESLEVLILKGGWNLAKKLRAYVLKWQVPSCTTPKTWHSARRTTDGVPVIHRRERA